MNVWYVVLALSLMVIFFGLGYSLGYDAGRHEGKAGALEKYCVRRPDKKEG